MFRFSPTFISVVLASFCKTQVSRGLTVVFAVGLQDVHDVRDGGRRDGV